MILLLCGCRTLISYKNVMKSEEQFGISLVYGAAYFLKGKAMLRATIRSKAPTAQTHFWDDTEEQK